LRRRGTGASELPNTAEQGIRLLQSLFEVGSSAVVLLAGQFACLVNGNQFSF
jgi:hypothetical protein